MFHACVLVQISIILYCEIHSRSFGRVATTMYINYIDLFNPFSVMATAAQLGQSHDQGPPAPQPVQQPDQEREATLKEGYIQSCEGYLKRRTKILKQWKKEWLNVVPGKCVYRMSYHILWVLAPVTFKHLMCMLLFLLSLLWVL